jgi:hypothetical protein
LEIGNFTEALAYTGKPPKASTPPYRFVRWTVISLRGLSEVGISEITVKAHRDKAMQKMKASSFAHLVTIRRAWTDQSDRRRKTRRRECGWMVRRAGGGRESTEISRHTGPYKSGNSTVLIYKSQFAGTNKATAATWVVDNVDKVVDQLKAEGVKFEHYDFPGVTRKGDVHLIGKIKNAWFKIRIAVAERMTRRSSSGSTPSTAWRWTELSSQSGRSAGIGGDAPADIVTDFR